MSQCFRSTLKFVQKMHAEIIICVHFQTKFVALRVLDTSSGLGAGMGWSYKGLECPWSGLVMVAGDVVERA